MQPRPQAIQLAAFRRIFLNMTISIALFAVVALLILPTQWITEPMFYVSLAVSIATVVLAPLAGRVPALPGSLNTDQAREAGLVAFRRSLFIRFAVVEVGALAGLIAAFMVHSTIPYLINAVVAVALMLIVVVPTPQRVKDMEERLNAGGAQSALAATLGV